MALELTCETCGTEFLLPAAERQYRQLRNLADPTTCPDCRVRERTARNADLIAMYEQSGSQLFTSADHAPNRGGPRRDRNGGRANGPRQMYNTVCAQCGSETQVPFVPRGDRPVYCRDCFNARNGR
jgi:CxxC-x17-CxxC domain-containing protein